MKILRVKVEREPILGGTHYVYPPEYDPGKISVIAYETSNPDNIDTVKARGNYEYLIGVVENGDAPGFLLSTDIDELTQGEAETAGATWIKEAIKINDEVRVVEILEKVRNSETLTAEEQKSIDPSDKTVSGLVYGTTFAERLLGTIK